MKKYRVGVLKPDALEMLIDVQPFEYARREPLKRLNFLLEFVKKNNPESFEKYVNNLIEKYKAQVKVDIVDKRKIILKEVIEDYSFLEKYSEIAKLSLNYYLHLHQISDRVDWKTAKIKIPNKNHLHSFLHPRYFNLLTLVETIGREEAIKLYKQYITHYYIEGRKDRENNYPDIKSLFENQIAPKSESSEWVKVVALINEGKYAFKNENCTWVDALQDLPDTELKYFICCYGDFEAAKFSNENFILTMEHTIAEGDPYCSRVYHDTRVDYDLRHPKKEFWDKFNP